MTLMLIKYQSLKKNHEGNTTMSFKINAKQLLKKYNQIWKIVQKLLKIEFDGKPVFGGDDKYIKTKIKIYGGKVKMITDDDLEKRFSDNDYNGEMEFDDESSE